jgi:integrase
MIYHFCLPSAYQRLLGVYRALTGEGKMTTGRISKKSVDALTCPPGKDREALWDEDLAGFGVVAFPSGSKAYIIQYRKDGGSHRITVGKHGRFTPDEARSEAKKMLGLIEAGSDLLADKRTARKAPLLREVADDFLTLHVRAKRKSRTYDEYARIVNQRILPAIGSMRMRDIKRLDIARLHGNISQTAPISANRALAVFSAIWSWASRRDILSDADNPAKGLERNREQGKERFLTSEELGRLGDTLRLAETDGLPWDVNEAHPNAKHFAKQERRRTIIDPFALAAIRLLLLTGARLSEILNAEWSQIDLERGILFLADSKTGRKPIYLSAAAQVVLNQMPKIENNPFLIAGSKQGQRRTDLKKPWAAIRRAAHLEGVRIHDLRHTFASFGAGAALGLPIIGKLLGHSQPSTTARYAHLDADPLRRAANQIGDTVARAMNPKSLQSPSKMETDQ